jgi:hypothetical protein
MKIARAIQKTEDGQADCFWHDNSMSMRYLIVLQGVTPRSMPESGAMLVAQQEGRVTSLSKEYISVSTREPGLMPGETGPLTILLVL